MPILIPIQTLEKRDLNLKGDLPPEELDLDNADELIHLPRPLSYDLEVEKVHDGILAKGKLKITLACECGRCLKAYDYDVVIDDWVCLLPLEGEEKAAIVHDSVDLTPYIREDIVLAFPQRPLCKPDCQGLTEMRKRLAGQDGQDRAADSTSSPWDELDKLKL